jgi:hypothetical protein
MRFRFQAVDQTDDIEEAARVPLRVRSRKRPIGDYLVRRYVGDRN